MSADRLARLRQVFESVVDLPGPERERLLARDCADDPALADEVRAMVASEAGRDVGADARPFDAALALFRSADRSQWVGRKVGRFELVGELGRGGMGQVFRARRIEDGVERWAAVKLMRDDVGSGSLLHRFANERQILARLNHPGIAHFIEAGTEGEGLVYVAMELVDGEPILDHARRNALDLEARLQLFRQLLAAVAYAHRNLVIHRDIKAANVLVRADGVVKLLDFGIAKPIDPSMTRTGTADRVFTPLSAAPEQLRGEAADVTTDIYALGVLLYELVSGVPPFDVSGLEPGEFERLVLSVPPPRMRDRVRRTTGASLRVPPDLEQIVQQALRKEQAQRYASIDLFDLDIQRFLADEPVSASGATTGYRLRKFVARHAWASGFAALASAAVIVALVVTIAQNRAIRAERDRANASLAVLRDAFVAADPTGRTEGQVSARDILERSVNVIEPLAASQPALYADIAGTIARTQLSIGLWTEARGVAGRATTAVRKAGEVPVDLVLLEARAAVEANDVQSAEAAEALLAGIPEARAEQDPDYWFVKARLATRRSEWPDALSHAARVLALDPTPDARWTQAVIMAAQAEAALDRPTDGDRRLLAATARIAQVHGGGHSLAAMLEIRRLGIQLDAGATMPEPEALDTLLAAFRTRFGAASVWTGDAEHLIAEAHLRRKDFVAASRHFSAAAAAYEAALGNTHPLSYRARFNAARVRYRVDRKRATDDFRALLATVSGIPAIDPGELAFFHLEAGKALAKPGPGSNPAEALKVLSDPLRDMPPDAIDAQNRNELATWLAYTYWQAGCAEASGGDWSPKAACASVTTAAACLAARARTCALVGAGVP